MKKTFKIGALFVMSILSAAVLAQTANDSKTVVNTNGVSMPACKRWTWSGDVYKRTVVCLEWRKKDKEEKKK